MRRAAQVLLLAAAGALVAPAVAEACWSGYYCESYGYDAGVSVYGYSRTYGYYGTYFLVETSITDPQWSTVSNWAEGMFDVTAEVWMDAGSGGDYYIEGNHYSNEWEGWYYDGTSYYSVYVSPPPPPPQITVCPVPSPPWGAGSQSAVIGGSGFWGNTPQVSWSGNGGVNFLQWSDASVASDSQIDLSVSLAPVTSEGSVTIGVGTAACVIPVVAAAPPACPHPASEVSVAGNWCSSCVGGTFTASLKDAGGVSPPNGKYQGRSVRERLSDLVDTCFFDGAEWRAVLPGEEDWSNWPVGSINGYGSDLIGWRTEVSAYYQNEVRGGRYSSCYVSMRQTMQIQACSGSTWAEYHSQDTRNTITSSEMTATRGNASNSGPIGD